MLYTSEVIKLKLVICHALWLLPGSAESAVGNWPKQNKSVNSFKNPYFQNSADDEGKYFCSLKE